MMADHPSDDAGRAAAGSRCVVGGRSRARSQPGRWIAVTDCALRGQHVELPASCC